MTEKTKEVVLTVDDISKYLESTNADAAAYKLHELVTNISTLIDRIHDLIEEDQMLSVISAVSFSAVLTAAGKPMLTATTGADKDLIIGLHALTDSFKELYMNKEEIE